VRGPGKDRSSVTGRKGDWTDRTEISRQNRQQRTGRDQTRTVVAQVW